MFSSSIVWYLFLAGVSSGAFLVATATMYGNHRKSHQGLEDSLSDYQVSGANQTKIPQTNPHMTAPSHFGIELHQSYNPSVGHIRVAGALCIASFCIIAGSLSLLATFSNPFIVWKVLLNPFNSITSFGATVVVIFAVLSVLATAVALLKVRLPHWIFITLMTLGVLSAISTMLYAGFLLIMIISVDFWSTLLIPLLFIVSSLTCGLAASLFVETIYLGIKTAGFSFRWNALLGLSLAEAIVLAILIFERAGYSPTALESVQMLLSGAEAWPFWLGVVSLGIGLPLVTHLLLPRLPLEALVLVSTAGTLIGGFFIRYCIVNAGLMAPIIPID